MQNIVITQLIMTRTLQSYQGTSRDTGTNILPIAKDLATSSNKLEVLTWDILQLKRRDGGFKESIPIWE